MRVLCLFPITGYESNIPSIMKHFKEKIMPELRTLGATALEFKFTGMDYVYVPNKESIEGQQKGKGIIDALKSVMDTPDVVIVCDGSNKIPYNYVIEIYQELISDSQTSCIMANRVGFKAISEFRYLVERFEVYSLRRFHNYQPTISDGQCGLWGFRNGKHLCNGIHKEIKLSATGYEIELDLLNQLLSNEMTFSFLDIEIPDPGIPLPTSFNFKNNIEKMEFLMGQYRQLSDCLGEYLNAYEKTEEARGLLTKGDIKMNWEEYKKHLLDCAKLKTQKNNPLWEYSS